MAGWSNVAFMHLCLATYFSPPDLVCVIRTSRDLCETYGTAETYRAVARSYFGPVEEGPRGHLSRRQRRKKGTWRAGDGAKARLSHLWQERTRNNAFQLQNAHLLQQREHERRWILQKAAAVMRTCAYAPRQRDDRCPHAKLRLWTSANIVAAKFSSRSHERPPSHHGVRCNRCNQGPIAGSCFRCAAGCRTDTTCHTRGSARRRPLQNQQQEDDGQRQQQQQQQQPSGSSLGAPTKTKGGERSGSGTRSRSRSGSKTLDRDTDGRGGGKFGVDGDASDGFYTLCEACFSNRSQFHPPHPFARLRAGFAEPRLSGPVLYEAVCGDCSFGSLVLVRPLKMHEALGDPENGDLWAVPVRVEAAGPLPLSQVKSRIAAGDRDDNRGLAFVSEEWSLNQRPEDEEQDDTTVEAFDPYL